MFFLYHRTQFRNVRSLQFAQAESGSSGLLDHISSAFYTQNLEFLVIYDLGFIFYMVLNVFSPTFNISSNIIVL